MILPQRTSYLITTSYMSFSLSHVRTRHALLPLLNFSTIAGLPKSYSIIHIQTNQINLHHHGLHHKRLVYYLTTWRLMQSCITHLTWHMTTLKYNTTSSMRHNAWPTWILSLPHCTSPTTPQHHRQMRRTLYHVHLLLAASSITPVPFGSGA